jgi:filamentous hemagglutinin family protein
MTQSRARSGFRPKLIALAVASCFTASTALANPTGANVVYGTAAIHQSGNLLQITNSPNAIINWQSFSIGANEITRFIQQSASSAVLNRVITQNPSTILGALQSNGRVFLINPNGILFGAGAQIDVGGLVASTLNMSDGDFLAGRLRFSDGLGKSVVNEGSITASAGGSVYLIGSGVTNQGIITSPQGEVILAAGNSVELVSPGTPNLRVEIAAADNEARNLGQIISDAGRIGIYAGLINNSGTIRADSAVAEGGHILLKATKNVTLEAGSVTTANGASGGSITVQSGDTTLVAGTVEAKGLGSPPDGGGVAPAGDGVVGKGGTVHVLGNLVGLIGDATVNASGETGGGTVLVGGDFQGKNPDVQNAFRNYFGPDATIKADAITSGDGGKVIVWSDDATRVYGAITARGGTDSGNGGFVETSGHYLEVTRAPDLTAANGLGGTWLLDPINITIVAGITLVNNVGAPLFTPAVTNSQVGADLIEAQLNNNVNVTLDTNVTGLDIGDITVNEPIVAMPTGSPILTLNANNQIILNQPITLTNGNGDVQLIAVNGIGQTAAGAITANQLYARGGSGSVLLNNADNQVNVLAGTATGTFLFRNAQALEIGTVVVAKASGISVVNQSGPAAINLNVTSGDLTVSKSVTAQGGTSAAASVSMTAGGGAIAVNGSTITANGGTAGSAGTGGSAQVTLNAGSSITLMNNSSITATGAGGVSGGGDATVTLVSGGDIALASSVNAIGGSGSPAGTAQIFLTFLTSTGNFSVNGVTGAIVDTTLGRATDGFFVDTLPAILDVNFFVIHLGAPVFNDVLIATINQQIDVLADQLKAGEFGEIEDEVKKKLPFCSS